MTGAVVVRYQGATHISSTHVARIATKGSGYHTPYVIGRPARQATQRFFERAIKADVPNCIIWPFAKDGDGYAKMRYGGNSRVVSRIVCELTSGPAPADFYQAAHSCHTPSCINPNHLSWKTPAENCADKIINGTSVVATQLGELNHSSKLTEAKVREIRQLAEVTSHRKIAAMFGISRTTAWSIIARQKWAHVK